VTSFSQFQSGKFCFYENFEAKNPEYEQGDANARIQFAISLYEHIGLARCHLSSVAARC
jgi:hypothetical protein